MARHSFRMGRLGRQDSSRDPVFEWQRLADLAEEEDKQQQRGGSAGAFPAVQREVALALATELKGQAAAQAERAVAAEAQHDMAEAEVERLEDLAVDNIRMG